MWFLHSSFFCAFLFLPKEQKWVKGKVSKEELYVVYIIYEKTYRFYILQLKLTEKMRAMIKHIIFIQEDVTYFNTEEYI